MKIVKERQTSAIKRFWWDLLFINSRTSLSSLSSSSVTLTSSFSTSSWLLFWRRHRHRVVLDVFYIAVVANLDIAYSSGVRQHKNLGHPEQFWVQQQNESDIWFRQYFTWFLQNHSVFLSIGIRKDFLKGSNLKRKRYIRNLSFFKL